MRKQRSLTGASGGRLPPASGLPATVDQFSEGDIPRCPAPVVRQLTALARAGGGSAGTGRARPSPASAQS